MRSTISRLWIRICKQFMYAIYSIYIMNCLRMVPSRLNIFVRITWNSLSPKRCDSQLLIWNYTPGWHNKTYQVISESETPSWSRARLCMCTYIEHMPARTEECQTWNPHSRAHALSGNAHTSHTWGSNACRNYEHLWEKIQSLQRIKDLGEVSPLRKDTTDVVPWKHRKSTYLLFTG